MDTKHGGSSGGGATTWLSLALEEIRREPRLDDGLYDVLRAFGKDDDDAPGPASLDPDAAGEAAACVLQGRIATELLDEIDADQASMFGRRFASVSTLLQGESADDKGSTTTRQLLRLALHRRTVQILSTDPVLSKRRALRVRALVDFVWSQSLVLSLKDDPENDARPTLVRMVKDKKLESSKSSGYQEFSPGFNHVTLEGMTSDFGPVHINILRIDLKKSSCQMKCIDARETCTDLSALAKQTGAVAAISGGFFLYSEPDIEPPSRRTDPVGLLVSDGSPVGPPVFGRAAILQKTGESKIRVDKVSMAGVTCTLKIQSATGTAKQQCIELTVGQDGVRCIHRGTAEEVAIEENECCLSIVGSSVIARQIGPSHMNIQVPLAGLVLVFPRSLLSNAVDITSDQLAIEVSYALPHPYDNVANAMSGGPMFFSDADGSGSMDLPSEDFAGSAPPVTFSQDETHDHNLLPRMGVGIARDPDSGDEQLVCVAVDGRNLDRALGLTLQGTSDLLRSLGCTKAMNLDGGSSKRMVIWNPKLEVHEVVCLSTTEIKANNNSATGNKNSDGNGKAAAEPSRPVH